MGIFTAKLRVWNPASSSSTEEIDAMVDTGAGFCARDLSIWMCTRCGECSFRTIEGKTIERDLVPVFVAADGFTGGDNVVMAEPGDMEMIGAHTLESLGLTVDPVGKKLVPTVGLALTAVLKNSVEG
jgi:predicted aspartyl protease